MKIAAKKIYLFNKIENTDYRNTENVCLAI